MNTSRQTIRTYSELIRISTYIERYRYLKLGGVVGEKTFGFERYLNQKFYTDDLWRKIRDHVIARDLGRDLGCEGYDIGGRIYIHHMNPITYAELIQLSPDILDPEFLICTAFNTHNAIHYGNEDLLIMDPIIRRPNDTCPWKR